MTAIEINLKSKRYELKVLDEKIIEAAASISRAGQTLAGNINRIGDVEYINTLSNKLSRIAIERDGIVRAISMLEEIQNNDEE